MFEPFHACRGDKFSETNPGWSEQREGTPWFNPPISTRSESQAQPSPGGPSLKEIVAPVMKSGIANYVLNSEHELPGSFSEFHVILSPFFLTKRASTAQLAAAGLPCSTWASHKTRGVPFSGFRSREALFCCISGPRKIGFGWGRTALKKPPA